MGCLSSKQKEKEQEILLAKQRREEEKRQKELRSPRKSQTDRTLSDSRILSLNWDGNDLRGKQIRVPQITIQNDDKPTAKGKSKPAVMVSHALKDKGLKIPTLPTVEEPDGEGEEEDEDLNLDEELPEHLKVNKEPSMVSLIRPETIKTPLPPEKEFYGAKPNASGESLLKPFKDEDKVNKTLDSETAIETPSLDEDIWVAPNVKQTTFTGGVLIPDVGHIKDVNKEKKKKTATTATST